MKNVVIPDFANNLPARIRLWEMKVGCRASAEFWIDLARSLADPAERMKLRLQRARCLLQRKLLEETAAMGSLELQTPRKSINNTPAQLWQWKNNTPYKEIGQRFHHRRWDYSVQKEGEEGRYKFEEDLQIRKREKLNLGINPTPEMNKKRGKLLGDDESDDESDPDAIDLESPEPEPVADDFYPNNEAFPLWRETAHTDAMMQLRISRNINGRRTAKRGDPRRNKRGASMYFPFQLRFVFDGRRRREGSANRI